MEAFFESLQTPGVTILCGSAGSGKSTLMREVEDRFPGNTLTIPGLIGDPPLKCRDIKIHVLYDGEDSLDRVRNNFRNIVSNPKKRIVILSSVKPESIPGVEIIDIRDLK